MRQVKLSMVNKKQKENEPESKKKFTDILKQVNEHLLKKIITREQLETFLRKNLRKY